MVWVVDWLFAVKKTTLSDMAQREQVIGEDATSPCDKNNKDRLSLLYSLYVWAECVAFFDEA